MNSPQKRRFELEAPVGETRIRAGPILRAAAHGVRLVSDGHLAKPHLVVLAGPRAGQRFAIDRSQTLGRGHDATIRLSDSEVSRLHARICTADGSAHLEDLNSKNGIRLNGQRLHGRHSVLELGDEITIGSTTMALVASSDEPLPARPLEIAARAEISPPVCQMPDRAQTMLLPVRPELALAGAVALLIATICLSIAAL